MNHFEISRERNFVAGTPPGRNSVLRLYEPVERLLLLPEEGTSVLPMPGHGTSIISTTICAVLKTTCRRLVAVDLAPGAFVN